MSDFGAKVQKHSSTSSDENVKTMLLAKLVIISKIQWCFVNNGGIIFMSDFGAKIQRHSSTSSVQNIKTMLLAKFVIISRTQWCSVNNGGIIFLSDFGPRSKDTLAPVVVQILKQC